MTWIVYNNERCWKNYFATFQYRWWEREFIERVPGERVMDGGISLRIGGSIMNDVCLIVVAFCVNKFPEYFQKELAIIIQCFFYFPESFSPL